MRLPRGVVKDHDRIVDRSQIVSEIGQPIQFLQLKAKEIPKFLADKSRIDKEKAEQEAQQANEFIINVVSERDTAKAELDRIKERLGILGLDINNLPEKLPESDKEKNRLTSRQISEMKA